MHVLDNPVWTALTTHQSDIAIGKALARRFPPDMCVHGAIASPSAQAFEALGRVADEPAGLFFPQPPELPTGWTITRQIEMFQMVYEPTQPPEIPLSAPAQLVELSAANLPEMNALYEATRPGRKLAQRIQRLGAFLGVRSGGKLVSMGGLRLHLPGYREITTVATHPEHLGCGYATALVAALAGRIRADGEMPFLHVRDDNSRAMQIYERLGFKNRRWFCYKVVRYGGLENQ